MEKLRRNMTVDSARIKAAKEAGYSDMQIVHAFPRGVAGANMVTLVEGCGLSAEAVVNQSNSEVVSANLDWLLQQDVSHDTLLLHLRQRDIDLNFDRLIKDIDVNLLVQRMSANGIVNHLYQLLNHDDLDVKAMLDKAGSCIEKRAALPLNDSAHIDLPLAARARWGIGFYRTMTNLASEARKLSYKQRNNHPYDAERLREISCAATGAAGELLRRGGVDLLSRYVSELADCGAVVDSKALNELAAREVANTDSSPTGFIYGIENLVKLGAAVDVRSWMRHVGVSRFAVVARELKEYGASQSEMLAMCQTAKEAERILFSLYGTGRSSPVGHRDETTFRDIVGLMERGIYISNDILTKLMPLTIAWHYDELQEYDVDINLRDIASRLNVQEFIANFAAFAKQGWHVARNGQLVDRRGDVIYGLCEYPAFSNEQ